jgi:hypothetical protein
MKENFSSLSAIIVKKDSNNYITRKLSYFADKENKVRVIGILD